MGRTFENDEAEDLMFGKPEGRKGISADDVRNTNRRVLREIDELLDHAYVLTFLEAKLHCDEYFEAKKSLGDLGEPYGSLHSHVGMANGTISARFQLRSSTRYGGLRRENLRKSKRGGYTEKQLRRHAGEYEGELAVMTEEHYQRLREQGYTLKELRRLLRGILIFVPKE